MLWFSTEGNAQKLRIVDSLSISKSSNAAIDDQGQIYLADKRGKIVRISPKLEKDLIYSPSTPADITILNARQGLRIFVFYKELQQFSYLDRFLSLSEKHTFNNPEIQFVGAATPSFDNKLWILDQPTLKLMKYNDNTQGIELSNNLEYTLPESFDEVVLFEEYHNNLFIGDNNGVFVFDNLGNYVSRFSSKGSWYGFHENAIYHVKDNVVISSDIYKGKQTTLKLPVEEARFVFFYEAYVFAVTNRFVYKMIMK